MLTLPRPRTPSRVEGRRSLASIALGVVLLGTAAAGHARGVTGRALITWQSFETEEQTSEGLRQTYDLGLRRSLSDPVHYRLWFRADGADTDLELAADRSSTSFRQIKVGGEVTAAFPKVQIRVIYDDIATDLDGERSGSRDLTSGTAQLAWRPDGLPRLSLEAEHRGFSDEFRGEDLTDTRFQGTLSDELGPLSFAATLRTTDLDDQRGALRRTDEVLLQAGLNFSFWNDRITTSAQLFAIESRIDERGVGAGAVPVAERIRVVEASSGIDQTPEDARDQPLAPAGGLIDGLFVPTGISLGPSGQTFRNVALDFGRVAEVDEVRLHVRDPAGELVPTGGQLDWRVYTSDDTRDWVRVFVGVVTRFDAARSLYEVRFTQLSTRHLKLVSFGLNLVETELVEVEAYDNRPIGPGERRRTDNNLASTSVSVTARPNDRVTASWSGRWNVFERAPEDEAATTTEDRDQYASLLVEATPWADLLVRYEGREATLTEGFRQDFEQWAAELVLAPRPGLDFRIEVLRSTDETDDRRLETEGLALKSHARLWRSVDLRLDLGELESDIQPDLRTLTRRFANAWLIAQLTPALQLTATLNELDSELSDDGPAVPGVVAPSERRWGLELYWRAGSPLGVGVRLGRAETDDFSANLRSLRIEWQPFRGGALRLGTLYDEEADTASRRTFRRLSLTPGWTINRHASLNLNYTIFEFDDDEPLRTESLLANFQVRR